MNRIGIIAVILAIIAATSTTGAYLLHRYNTKEKKQSEDIEDILPGYEHYELEFFSYDPEYYENATNYDSVLRKYFSPVRVTVGELNKDFPFDEALSNPNSISQNSHIDLDNDEYVWVYATYCYSIWDSGNDMHFVYDNVIFTDELVDIDTHFETNMDYTNLRNDTLIVISIFPERQFDFTPKTKVDALECYEVELYYHSFEGDEIQKNIVDKYRIPKKTKFSEIKKYLFMKIM